MSGFGLVELLVSISIMVIVTSVILVRQNSFNSAILLRSQAYQVALEIRNIQFSAVSISSAGGSYESVVGLHFDDSAGNNNNYRIFSDQNDNRFYEAGTDDEFGIQGQLDSRFEISDIRAVGAADPGVGGLSVVFVRPDFDAEFTDSTGTLAASSIEIDISRRDSVGGPNDTRTVEVTSTGQISVQ